MTTKYHTDAPALSDATVARLRTAARRYLLAGGSIFPHYRATDHDEYISNMELATIGKEAGDAFNDLLKATVTYDTHEHLYKAAWNAISTRSDMAFLFGALVGLESAASTFGRLATVAVVARPKKSHKR